MRSALALLCLAAACSCDPEEVCQVVGPAPDGSSALVCPDGSRVEFPATHGYEGRGALEGDVALFGLPPVAGLRVGVAGPELYSTVTDAGGRFRLEELPPGFHSLVFEAPGYHPIEQHDVLVLPGVHQLPKVTLRPGRLVVARAGQLYPSPRGDGCLYLSGRALYLFRAESGRTQLVSRSAGRPEYAYGGSAVLFLERFQPGGSGDLVLLDVGTGERTGIASPASEWTVAGNGSAIAVLAPSGSGIGRTLQVWDRQSGVTSTVANHVQEFRLGPDGRRLTLVDGAPSLSSESAVVLWDVAAQAGVSFASADWTLPLLSPDGNTLVYRTPTGEHLLWDGLRQRAQRLGPDLRLDGATFDDSGRFILFSHYRWRFVLHDVATGVSEPLAPEILAARFAPGAGGLVTLAERSDRVEELVLEELPDGGLETVWAGVQSDAFVASWVSLPDELLFRTVDTSSGSGTLRRFSVGGGVVTVAEDVPEVPLLEPSGDGMLFLSGDELLRRERGGSTAERLASGVDPGAWFEHGPGDGDALIFEPAQDGTGTGRLSRYDALLGRAVLLGDPIRFQDWQAAGDGSLAARRTDGQGGPAELVVQQRGARAPRLLATGVSRGRGFSRSPEGARLVSYRDDPAWGSRVAQLHDLPRGATVPLDSDVSDVAVGEGFVAYVVHRRGPDNGLYLSLWPEAPPLPLPEEDGGPPAPVPPAGAVP